MTPDGEDDVLKYNFAPPAVYLPTLISLLPTLSRPVIVVLDAFDFFRSTSPTSLILGKTAVSERGGTGCWLWG